VLPFDFGTTPADDAGIPGLNTIPGLNQATTFTSGLPALFIEGDRGFNAGSGLGVNRCNCPLDQDEKQWQIVGNLTKIWGNHSIKFGADVRRAYNLRVPSDSHRSGELTFNVDRTRGPSGGGLGLATFLLGDVTRLARYVSQSTDARERQWRHFYYAQDTWRPTAKITLNYGLRLDVINPQTVNGAGQGGWLDIDTGLIQVAGVGNNNLAGNVDNNLNWAPRLGMTYQLDEKTVIRGGFGRSYDIGVFGSLFGHSVTQNLPVLAFQEQRSASGENYDAAFNLAQGPNPPPFPAVPSNGLLPLPNGVSAKALPKKQRPPTVDAFNVTVQRQLTDVISVEAGYVGNRGRDVFSGDGPEVGINDPTLDGFPNVPQNLRRPFFAGNVRTPYLNLGGPYGWTQGIGYFCNCANNWYDSLQTKLTKRFSNGYSYQVNYTWQKAENEDGSYFFWDRTLNKGVTDWNRSHTLNIVLVYELPFGRGRKWAGDISPTADAFLGGWQFNATHNMSSGIPFNVSYRDNGADRDTGPNRPNLIGDPEAGGGSRDRWFNTTPIGTSGSAFGRPAVGTFGDLERNALTGPGYRRTDASLFKHFRVGGSRDLEVRIEVVNLFNNVNLGNPDSEVGVPGNDNANAGRINSTAYFNADPQRNFQFAVKFQF
jgi:hypothetical protein